MNPFLHLIYPFNSTAGVWVKEKRKVEYYPRFWLSTGRHGTCPLWTTGTTVVFSALKFPFISSLYLLFFPRLSIFSVISRVFAIVGAFFSIATLSVVRAL